MFRIDGCILAVLLVASTGCGRADKSTEISAVFRQYQDAVAARDGQTAARFIAAQTLEEYATVRDLALTAEPADLQRQRPAYQLKALMLRQFSPPDLDETSDGGKVFAIFVEHRTGSEEGARQLSMFNISDGNASAALQVDGRLTRQRFHFIQEDESWKLDLRASYAEDGRLEDAAREAGMPLGDYLVRLVGELTQQTPREDLWRPLRVRDGGD